MGRACEGFGHRCNYLASMMASLQLEALTKQFGAVTALQSISLNIRSGEFFSILGPSGCGKTTLLRLIAGFESPTSGSILLDGKDLTRIPPRERGIGMVFQNYALFPHMTVFENVAFGLQVRRMSKDETRTRTEAVLGSVGLRHKASTPIPNLSGGEQQRVAVARALVIEPSILLFDEPLSNLDVGLRRQTREEIRSLQRMTRITTIYVTHDQSEAMSLSDRVAVLRAGRLEQLGSPEEMYRKPDSRFVAQFLGGSSLLDGLVSQDQRSFVVGKLMFPIPEALNVRPGKATLAVRPEAVHLSPGGIAGTCCGEIEDREYLGYLTTVVVALGEVKLHVVAVSSEVTRAWIPGTSVGIQLNWEGCTMWEGN